MKSLLRLCGLCALLAWLPAAWGQTAGTKVSRIDIKHVGPSAVSDDLIRANIRIKPGDPYRLTATDDDVANLYATGLFSDIRITIDRAPDGGVVLTYITQDKPRLTDIKFQGNKKFDDAKLKKKISSKVGEPLDERKLFTDCQSIQEMYQKAGYPGTKVEYVPNVNPETGRGTATFEVKEGQKIKITRVEFIGAQAFSQGKLRKQIKTRTHWLFSWLTGSGVFKSDQFEDDQDRLAEFYRDKGYIDFEIKGVQTNNPTPKTMVVRFQIYEGHPYNVGAVTFQGTTLLPTNAISSDFKAGPAPKGGPERLAWQQGRQLNRSFAMKPGNIFTTKGFLKDIEAVEDFYGAKGYLDVATSTGNLAVNRVPNTDTGTMDLQFKVEEGQKSYVEKIEIRGNYVTKDKVIRRELAISPGEVFDMVSVKVSKQRLGGLQYFEKVDARPEPMDPPITGRKNLVVGVEEKKTGNLTFGAGFSSVDSVVGFAEISQGNFDLFHPPTFTGGGQKFRLRVQLGNLRQDYILSFVEPWFLGRKLALGTELYYRSLNFQSVDNIYDEIRAGARLSLTRALWSDFLIGSVYYNIEDVGIVLNSGFHGPEVIQEGGSGRDYPGYVFNPANVPTAILNETGYHLLSRFGASLAYDTRNSTYLPDAGQRTELFGEVTGGPLGGDKEFYKLELKTAWYFRGFFRGHVLELVGRGGIADGFGGQDVPFYERFFLGGLSSLRGFRYRDISPREPGFTEPIGGDTYWFGSAEYSLPIIQKEKGAGVRFAVFYDIGAVESAPYSFTGNFSDNWGFGLRLDLPVLHALRLDYGIPIHHDSFSSGSGKFQFGVGYTREF
jgi:outer membrane protein insertion porin family